MRRVLLVVVSAALLAIAVGTLIVVGVPRFVRPASVTPSAAPDASSATPARKIRASLFFVAEDGMRLVAVDQEVAYGDNTVEQARRLVEAQLGPAPQPYARPLPEGTALRALFVTDRAEAFVDLSGEVTARHSGGSLDELFSVYAIVNTLTTNLPAITRVQILVDGKEVDSLAGHIDLRRPLTRNLTWVRQPGSTPEAVPSPAPGTAIPPPPPAAAPGGAPTP